MIRFRYFPPIAAAVAALAIALPAFAGNLAPRLQALSNAHGQKHPGAAPTRTLQPQQNRAAPLWKRSRPARLFTPHVNAAGEVQVYLHYEIGALPSAETLSRLGADDVLVSAPLGVVQAWIPIAKLGEAAALKGVSLVGLPDYLLTRGPRSQANAASCGSLPAGLDIDAAAIAAQNVAELHARNITGSGVKVGIVSNGAECLSASQSAGYLPNNIYIPAPPAGSGSEGTAMLEEVHAVAPDAALGFCGPTTSAEFLHCFEQLAQWGADVISDDIFFPIASYNFSIFTNPATGENAFVVFAQAHPHISLATAAGNDAKDYFEAHYVADTTPSSPDLGSIPLEPEYTVAPPLASVSAANRSYVSAMNFGQAAGAGDVAAMRVKLRPGFSVLANLTWNDPASGPYDDLDLFLFEEDGTLACTPSGSGADAQWCSSTRDQTAFAPQGMPPFERLSYKNTSGAMQTLYLVAYCYACSAHGTNPLFIKLYGFMNSAGTFNFTTDGGIMGRAALEVETAVAAAWRPRAGLIGMEPSSARGPFTYGDWTQPLKTRPKPDITGIDRILVSGAGGFGQARDSGGATFAGTSAAVPNVGGVIALLRGAAPSAAANAAAWEDIIEGTASTEAINGFQATTQDGRTILFEDYSPTASGAGLVDAAAAADSIVINRPPPSQGNGGGGGGAFGGPGLGLLGALVVLLALRRRRRPRYQRGTGGFKPRFRPSVH